MKKLLAALCLTVTCFAVYGFFGLPATHAAAAFDVYELVSEEHLLIYENEIAKRPVVSNLNEAQLAKTALYYDISVDKLKKILCFQHAMSLAGYDFSVAEIAAMTPSELLSNGAIFVEWLKANRSPEELAALAEKFKGLV